MRDPIIHDHRGAMVCQSCLVKWARVRVNKMVYCAKCANKEREKIAKLEADHAE